MTLHLRSLIFIALVMSACSGAVITHGPTTQVSPDSTYPAGPYGYSTNDIAADFKVSGKQDPGGAASLLSQPTEDIWLSGYRKTFPVIFITISAEWCVHCVDAVPQLEDLNTRYNQKKPTVAFLEVMAESGNTGPAGLDTLTRWITRFGMTYDVAIDPDEVLQPYYANASAAFPTSLVIRTSDMHIMLVQSGIRPSEAQPAIDALIGG